MTLDFFRLLFDFGLLILIWMVQLIVYPSFLYYSRNELIQWHNRYTQRITLVVFPLMAGQLILSGMQFWQEMNLFTGFNFAVVLALWASTFLQFVPLHSFITQGRHGEDTLEKLVSRNWLRTFLWSGLALSSLLKVVLE